MDHFDRSIGRLLPYTYGSFHSQVPPFYGIGQNLSVRSPPVWTGNSPQGVYYGSQGTQENCLENGFTDISVHRRLAESSGFVRPNCDEKPSSPKIDNHPRMACKREEIRVDSNSSFSVPGIHVRSPQRSSVSSGQKSASPFRGNFTTANMQSHNSKASFVSARSHGMHGEASSTRSAPYETDSTGTQTTMETSEHSYSESQDCGISQSPTPSTVVVRSTECHGNSATSATNPIHIHLHGCISGGLGCSHGSVHSTGSVECNGVSTTFKSQGTQSSLPWFEGSSSKLSRSQDDPGSFGQFHSSMVYQQTGGNQVSQTDSTHMEIASLVQNKTNQSSSQTYSGSPKCDSRHPFQKEPDSSHGMDSRSECFSRSLPKDVHSDDRPVCHSVQQQTSPVCISSPRQPGTGGRCDDDRLEREIAIRVPSHSTGSQDCGQGAIVSQGGASSNSSIEGSQYSLCSVSAEVCDSADKVATGPQAPKATSSKSVSQKSSSLESSRILAEDHLKDQGFQNTEVVDRIINPIRKSSKSCYDARWNCFIKYCEELKIKPTSITIPQLCDFFLHLFKDKQYKTVTIKGYRSALNPHLQFRLGDLGSNTVLAKLFQSFERDRPKTMNKVQPWDLTLILHALTQKPFEPLDMISLKFLSWKTAFLLALATGRRCCELHAIRKEKIFHKEKWNEVTFSIDHFLCKNQGYEVDGEMFKSFTIPALAPTLDRSCKEDRSLCPIRALRYYLNRTKKELNGDKYSALFVPLRDTGRELSKASFSNWIKECIKYCISNCSTENAQVHSVRAHDVRALAASWSLAGGYSLNDIMRACTWKNHLTFTRFYLKDSVQNDLGEHRLGSFIAAQSVVHF